ncbi:hypothetical protein SRHO_G00253290 [Serrasalmus rhombeus]
MAPGVVADRTVRKALLQKTTWRKDQLVKQERKAELLGNTHRLTLVLPACCELSIQLERNTGPRRLTLLTPPHSHWDQALLGQK